MTPYEIIKDYCENKSLSKLYERILFHKYTEEYNNLIIDYKESEKHEPTLDTLKGFESTLLSDNSLSTSVRIAEDDLKEYTKKEVNKALRKYSFKEFCFSTLASIIASILFSLLLIFLFTVASKQIKSYINDLYSDQSFIKNKITNTNENINN